MRHDAAQLVCAALVAALGVGCGGKKRDERETKQPSPSDSADPTEAASQRVTIPPDVDIFHYGYVDVTTAPVPARFSAELPTSIEALRARPGDFPPLATIGVKVCQSDVPTLERVRRAVEAAAAADTLSEELTTTYERLFAYCTAPALCDWAAAYVATDAPLAARRALWPALSNCVEPKYEAAATAPDAPAMSILEWYFNHDEKPAVTPALRAAAEREATTADLRSLAYLAARLAQLPGGEALVADVHATLDADRAAHLAIGLDNAVGAKARALFAAACAYPTTRESIRCERAAGRNHDPSGSELFEEPKKPTADELAACASEPVDQYDYEQIECLGALVALDRPRAVELAATLHPPQTARRLAIAVHTLRAYPDAGALEKAMAEWGLVNAGLTLKPPGITASHLLEQAQRVHRFDVETGRFPNNHHALMLALAADTPDLAGAEFDEYPPADYDGGSYELYGYHDGKRYVASAENLGDWYDLPVVIGMLNTMLRERGSAWRYVTLPAGGQVATVLAGPVFGILAAARAGVLVFEDASTSMLTGKASEDYMFDQLESEGEDVKRNVRFPLRQ